MQTVRLNWNDASLWVLVGSCYATIGGMIFFLATHVWPVWLTTAAMFTLVIGAPALILRIMIGHRTRFRIGMNPMQGIIAGLAVFFYLGLVGLVVAGI